MRKYIDLMESVDEFSTKGHADLKIRRNDPRFADNPMASPEDYEELDEFVTDEFAGLGKLDRLHDIFRDAKISDQELKLGVKLTPGGIHKIAAALGTSPAEVQSLIAILTQHLNDDQNDATEQSLQEQYRRFLEADEIPRPFAQPADDHLSAETDYLGDVTVRSQRKGNEKFYQGSAAANITKRLASATDDQKQNVLRPLSEDDAIVSPSTGFADEINSDSGSYNFPWKINGESGFGTAFYKTAGGKPSMRIISVRDAAGEDVDADPAMHQALLIQARSFIPDA